MPTPPLEYIMFFSKPQPEKLPSPSSHGRMAKEGIRPANSIPDPRVIPEKQPTPDLKPVAKGACKKDGIYPTPPSIR